MLIQLVNQAGIVADEVERARVALNEQLAQFFGFWDIGCSLTTEPGDATLYLVEHIDVAGALGYHDVARGKPIGFVDMTLAARLGEPWTVTASHEMLELAADPLCNLLVQGRHPEQPRTVFHWYEMCDAVQADTYPIDIGDGGPVVMVSNFLLPHYFTQAAEADFGNDYMELGVGSFKIRPGGYVGYYDPVTHRHETSFGDQLGRDRWDAKQAHCGRKDFIRAWELLK